MASELSPAESAREAGLRYVDAGRPGLRRVRSGKGFRYLLPDGTRLTDRGEIERIRRLAIPPAWTDVWICPDPRGHLQATGRDSRGRKVYRYHPRWRQTRDELKYGRLLDFARALPRIRSAVRRDLSLRGLPREKVLAVVVALLDRTWMRIGNPQYARENRSFGLTTLRTRHARVGSRRIRFRFRGKSGKQHEVSLIDRRLARVVGRLQELPGQELFVYLDEDRETHAIHSDDVNGYLREISGDDFTAKEFRTWAGTVCAAMALAELDQESSARPRRNVVRAVEAVAEELGNTPAVSRSAYVHPGVIEAYLEGETARVRNADRPTREGVDREGSSARRSQGRRRQDLTASVRLDSAERAVVALLKRRAAAEAASLRQAASTRRSARR